MGKKWGFEFEDHSENSRDRSYYENRGILGSSRGNGPSPGHPNDFFSLVGTCVIILLAVLFIMAVFSG